jgi:hypothetical protein
MDIRRSLRDPPYGVVLRHLTPHAKLTMLTVLAAAPIVAVSALVPRALVLPVVSLVAIAAAMLFAFLSWMRPARRHGETITSWDIAGACVLIGCGAAMLSEPESVLNLLGPTMVP